VNAFWTPRDESASPEPSGEDTGVNGDEESEDGSDGSSGLEEGEVDSRSDSDAVSLDSEADDSILLNIGEKAEDTADEYRPEDVVTNGQTNGHVNGVSEESASAPSGSSESKEEAFERYAKKYPTPPAVLMDLRKGDMEIQAQFIYWDQDINDIDLQLPVGCTECLQFGHQAEVCPTKEVCIFSKARQ
jgi:protein AIR1/2